MGCTATRQLDLVTLDCNLKAEDCNPRNRKVARLVHIVLEEIRARRVFVLGRAHVLFQASFSAGLVLNKEAFLKLQKQLEQPQL